MNIKNKIVILFILLKLDTSAQFHYADTIYHLQKYDEEYLANSLKFSDDKFVMWGYAVRDHYYQNIFAVNSSVDTLWDKEFIIDSLNNTFYNFKTALDIEKNILIAGGYYDTILKGEVATLTKADSNGNFIWLKKYYAPNYNNEFQGLFGNYPIVTNTYDLLLICQLGVDTGNADFLIIKTDSNGNELSRWQYGTPYYERPRGGGIQTTDGGFLFGGFSDTLATMYHEYYSIYIIKTDSAGNMLWDKFIQPLHSVDSLYVGDASCYAMLEVADGYIIAGSRSNRSNLNYPCAATCPLAGPRGWAKSWFGKIDKQDGHLIWEHYYGIDTSDFSRFEAITQTPDGGYALCGGYSYRDDSKLKLWVLRTNAQGDSLWSRTFLPFNSDSTASRLNSICTIGSSGFIVSGYVQPLNNVPYPWIITIDSNGCVISNCLNGTEINEPPNQEFEFSIYPNPVNDNLYIKYFLNTGNQQAEITITNITGEIVSTTKLENNYGEFIVSTNNLSAGIYFCALRSANQVVSVRKIVKL